MHRLHYEHFLLAHRRADGLIDFALLEPMGPWAPRLKCVGRGARDERQMCERAERFAPAWQDDVSIEWVPAERIDALARAGRSHEGWNRPFLAV